MAQSKNGGNGRIDRLEEAMAALGQAQANLTQQHAALEQAQANLTQQQAALGQAQTHLTQQQTTLEQAQAHLVHAQANLVQANAALAQQHTLFLARIADIDARIAETNRINSEIFARIEQRFVRIEAILMEHSRILRALPDAIRDKIGFRSPPPQV